MTRRHVVAAGLAAVLAAGPVLALSAAPAQAATPAAAKPRHVAVVVSGHGTYCVTWKSGITGDTVLNDVATVAYRSDGIILQIDGVPSSGKADDTHYWSYWHDTDGKRWAYSNVGASGYDPRAGSVEGWSYDNGKASAPSPSQKPAGLYSKLCGAKDRSGGTVVVPVTSTAAPTTTATSPTSAAPRTTPATRHHSAPTSSAPRSPGRTTGPPTTSAAPSRTATSTATTPRTTSAAPTRTATAAASSSGTSAAAPPSSPTPSAPDTIDASPAASSSSSGSPTGLFVALGLVVVLGAGAGVFALRRRSAGS